jgi:hypothetical protein
MSDYEKMRELLAIDPREAFLNTTGMVPDAAELEERDIAKGHGDKPVCILCESGYHDHEWEITHIMQCGCPCHMERSTAIGAGK